MSKEMIKKFLIRQEIARGGMGIVFEGTDPTVKRKLAIKALSPELAKKDDQVVIFLQEAHIHAQLQHPNICPVHEIGNEDAQPYFSMKKIEGKSLQDIISLQRKALQAGEAPPYKLNELLEMFKKVCNAIGFAHEQNVIHRDLKPANVMVGEYGEVLVVDWGLAKRLPGKTNIIMPEAVETALKNMKEKITGTPSYMPPEQAQGMHGKMDQRSDIYSLGGILYALLSGRRPIDGKDATVIMDLVKKNKITVPSKKMPSANIPADLEACVMKAMAGSRKNRYQSVKEMLSDIDAFLEGKTLAAADYNVMELAQKWVQRNKPVAITLAAALLIMTATVIIFVSNLSAEKDKALAAHEEALVAKGNAEKAATAAGKERDRAKRAETLAQQKEKEASEQRQVAEMALSKFKEAQAATKVAQKETQRQTKKADQNLGLGMIAQGDAQMLARKWNLAKKSYSDGISRLKTMNADILAPSISLWQTYQQSPAPLLTLPKSQQVLQAAALSPSGQYSATGGHNNEIYIHDLASNKLVATLKGHEDFIEDLVFISDDRVISASADTTIGIWDWKANKRITTLEGHDDVVTCLALSENHEVLASGANDATIRTWNLQDYSPKKTYKGHKGFVTALIFYDKSHKLVSGSSDGEILLWNVTGKIAKRFKGHSSAVTALCMSPSAGFISTGQDKRIITWSTKSSSPKQRFAPLSNVALGLTCLKSQRAIASFEDNGAIKIWDVKKEAPIQQLYGHNNSILASAWHDDHALLLTTGMDKQAIVWSLNKAVSQPIINSSAGFPREQWLSPTGLCYSQATKAGNIETRDIHTQKAIHLVKTGFQLKMAAFSANGKFALLVSKEGVLQTWDIIDGKKINQRKITGDYYAIAIDKTGKKVAVGQEDKVLYFQDKKTVLSGPSGWVQALAFDDDGKLYAGDQSGDLHLWQAGKSLGHFNANPNPITTIKPFSKRQQALTGDEKGNVSLLQINSKKILKTHRAHSASISALDLSPDGKHIITGAENRKFKLWQSNDFSALKTFTSHKSSLSALRFSHNNTDLISGDIYGWVRSWPFSHISYDEKSELLARSNQAKDLSQWFYLKGQASLLSASLEDVTGGQHLARFYSAMYHKDKGLAQKIARQLKEKNLMDDFHYQVLTK